MLHFGPKVPGVVLSGGGVYAAYEVGVLKALIAGASSATAYQPLEPMVLSGTSAGAFNAAVFISTAETSAAEGVAALEDVWREEIASRRGSCGNGVYRIRVDWRHWLNPACSVVAPERARPIGDLLHISGGLLQRTAQFWSRTRLPLEQRALQFVDLSSLLSVEPFERLIHAVLRPIAVQRSGRALRIVVTNWANGQLVPFANQDITEEQGAQIVLASAAIPGFFPPVRIGDNAYVDGGVLMNTPVQPAIRAGADVVHVIYMDPDPSTMQAELESTISIFDRALLLARADVIERDIATISRINHTLDALQKSGRASSTDRARPGYGLTNDRDGRRFRLVTVHRHRPTRDLGGVIGVLDMDEERIDFLIRQGEQDTVEHRCDEAGCVTAASNWGSNPQPSITADERRPS